MSSDVPQENVTQDAFEDLTLSELLTTLLGAGYSFDQIKRLTMKQIYGVVRESSARDADAASRAQAA